MAEVVLLDRLSKEGLADVISADSAGTGSWHVGDEMDPRAATALQRHGYVVNQHRARQFSSAWLSEIDLVVAMDRSHARALRSMVGESGCKAQVRLLGSFGVDQVAGVDVPDPYYGTASDFESALVLIEKLCDYLICDLRKSLQEGFGKGDV